MRVLAAALPPPACALLTAPVQRAPAGRHPRPGDQIACPHSARVLRGPRPPARLPGTVSARSWHRRRPRPREYGSPEGSPPWPGRRGSPLHPSVPGGHRRSATGGRTHLLPAPAPGDRFPGGVTSRPTLLPSAVRVCVDQIPLGVPIDTHLLFKYSIE